MRALKKGLLFLLFVFFTTSTFAKEINYNSKKIKKGIKKVFKTKQFTIVENTHLVDSFVNGKYYTVNGENKILGYLYVGRVMSCNSEGCDLASNDEKSFSLENSNEYFDYFIIVNLKKSVELVKIFNYQATHGHAVCSKWWLKQFRGYDGTSKLNIGKDVDAVSGATISTNALSNDIYKIVNFIKKEY